MKNYDVIIVGAGSVGLPLAHRLAVKGVSVGVIDELPSPGQGQNKAAIGGIRATHSDRAKIQIGIASLEFIRRLEPEFGQDVDYVEGATSSPPTMTKLAGPAVAAPHSKELRLEHRLIGPEEVREIVPGIRAKGLLGGTFSPEDGHLSSLKLAGAFLPPGAPSRGRISL